MKNFVVKICQFEKRQVRDLLLNVWSREIYSLIKFFIVDWDVVFFDVDKSRENYFFKNVKLILYEIVQNLKSRNSYVVATIENRDKWIEFRLVFL